MQQIHIVCVLLTFLWRYSHAQIEETETWLSWQEWSVCEGNGNGLRRRERTCSSFCDGSSIQFENCPDRIAFNIRLISKTSASNVTDISSCARKCNLFNCSAMNYNFKKNMCHLYDSNFLMEVYKFDTSGSVNDDTKPTDNGIALRHPGIFYGIRLFEPVGKVNVMNILHCIAHCNKSTSPCDAVTFIMSDDVDTNCHLFGKRTYTVASEIREKYISWFRVEDLVQSSIVEGDHRFQSKTFNVHTCLDHCNEDPHCISMSFYSDTCFIFYTLTVNKTENLNNIMWIKPIVTTEWTTYELLDICDKWE
jgi:hypothetical protein